MRLIQERKGSTHTLRTRFPKNYHSGLQRWFSFVITVSKKSKPVLYGVQTQIKSQIKSLVLIRTEQQLVGSNLNASFNLQLNSITNRPVGWTIMRSPLEQEVWDLNLGPVKSDSEVPTYGSPPLRYFFERSCVA